MVSEPSSSRSSSSGHIHIPPSRRRPPGCSTAAHAMHSCMTYTMLCTGPPPRRVNQIGGRAHRPPPPPLTVGGTTRVSCGSTRVRITCAINRRRDVQCFCLSGRPQPHAQQMSHAGKHVKTDGVSRARPPGKQSAPWSVVSGDIRWEPHTP